LLLSTIIARNRWSAKNRSLQSVSCTSTAARAARHQACERSTLGLHDIPAVADSGSRADMLDEISHRHHMLTATA
jgi:hypothetical protein